MSFYALFATNLYYYRYFYYSNLDNEVMIKQKKTISKKQYEKAKQIVSEYEAQFSSSFVRGSFKASDLDYILSCVLIPKIKNGMLTDDELSKLQNYLDELGVPWFDLGCEDMGHLVIGGQRYFDYLSYESKILDALNRL